MNRRKQTLKPLYEETEQSLLQYQKNLETQRSIHNKKSLEEQIIQRTISLLRNIDGKKESRAWFVWQLERTCEKTIELLNETKQTEEQKKLVYNLERIRQNLEKPEPNEILEGHDAFYIKTAVLNGNNNKETFKEIENIANTQRETNEETAHNFTMQNSDTPREPVNMAEILQAYGKWLHDETYKFEEQKDPLEYLLVQKYKTVAEQLRNRPRQHHIIQLTSSEKQSYSYTDAKDFHREEIYNRYLHSIKLVQEKSYLITPKMHVYGFESEKIPVVESIDVNLSLDKTEKNVLQTALKLYTDTENLRTKNFRYYYKLALKLESKR